MAQNKAPLFLERGTYRRRRLMDAVRLVAFFGVGLWMMPVLWPVPEADGDSFVFMSSALHYVFSAWLVLIVVSFFLSIFLPEAAADAEADEAGSEQ